jgi:hypothetical protein
MVEVRILQVIPLEESVVEELLLPQEDSLTGNYLSVDLLLAELSDVDLGALQKRLE